MAALDFVDPQQAGILALAGGMLQGMAPSRNPVSLSGAFGQGLTSMNQAQLAARDQQLKQILGMGTLSIEQQKLAQMQLQLQQAQQQFDMQSGILQSPEIRAALGFPSGQQPAGPALNGAPTATAPGAMPNGSPAPMGAPDAPQAPVSPQGQFFPGVSPAAFGLTAAFDPKNMGQVVQQGYTEFNKPITTRFGVFTRTPNGGVQTPSGFLQAEAEQVRARTQEEEAAKFKFKTVEVEDAQGRKVPRLVSEVVGNPMQPPLNLTAPNEEVAKLMAQELEKAGQKFSITVGQPKATPLGQTTESRSRATESGSRDAQAEDAAYQAAQNATQMKVDAAALKKYAGNFDPGALAPYKATVGNWLIGMGAPAEEVNRIFGSIGDMQAAQKITYSIATGLTKNISSRPTQMEWAQILKNATPNIAMTKDGFEKVLTKMEKDADRNFNLYQEWEKSGKTGSFRAFAADYNKRYLESNQEAAQPTIEAPKGQTFDARPPASQFKGKTITDTTTGQKYQSDGMTWKPIPTSAVIQ